MDSAAKISEVCDSIKTLLLEKNAKYGDSALDPIRVFSNSSPMEQLLVRIDDKLSRISRGVGLIASDEDILNDLIGYLVLLKIAIREEKPADLYEDVKKAFRSDTLDCQWNGIDVEPDYAYRFFSRSPD